MEQTDHAWISPRNTGHHSETEVAMAGVDAQPVIFF